MKQKILKHIPLKLKHIIVWSLNLFFSRNNLLSCIFKTYIGGGKNTLHIKSMTRLKNCHFRFKGNGNQIIIGKRCKLNGLHIMLEGNNNIVYIGNNVIINASQSKPTIMNAVEGTSIYIGDECLFSNNIELHTSDYHSILDNNTSVRINPSKNIQLEERVWVGLRTIILKGTYIASNSIIGAGSIVSGQVKESNVIIAGCPAIVRKKNVKWMLQKINSLTQPNVK